jgi:hypothetical protein
VGGECDAGFQFLVLVKINHLFETPPFVGNAFCSA